MKRTLIFKMYFSTYISHYTVTSLLSTIICQIGHIINRFITAFVKAPIIFIETQLDGFISFYQTQIFIDIICIICKFTLSNLKAGQTQLWKVFTQTSLVHLKNSSLFRNWSFTRKIKSELWIQTFYLKYITSSINRAKAQEKPYHFAFGNKVGNSDFLRFNDTLSKSIICSTVRTVDSTYFYFKTLQSFYRLTFDLRNFRLLVQIIYDKWIILFFDLLRLRTSTIHLYLLKHIFTDISVLM